MGSAGSTSIEENEDRRLKEYWEGSDLWPKTREYATSVFGPQGNPKIFLNYCPEIAYERFGYFASHLAKYTDGIDSDSADRILTKRGGSQNDWRWFWSSLTPVHYTDCQLYSVLDYRSKINRFPFYNEKSTKDESWHKSLIGKIFIGVIIGLSVWVISNLIGALF